MQNKYDDTEEIIINQDSIEYKEKNNNVEEDIKLIDEIIHKKDGTRMGYIDVDNFDDDNICERFIAAIENMQKRINELEEENRIQRSQIMSVYDRGWIPKQKVKDILQNNRNELFGVIYLNSKQYEPYEKQIERINKIEKELLEDKQ